MALLQTKETDTLAKHTDLRCRDFYNLVEKSFTRFPHALRLDFKDSIIGILNGLL